MTNYEFWKVVKPFLTNKGVISSNVIVLEENGELISNEKELVEIFNNYYINTVENTTGTKPIAMGDPSNPNMDTTTVHEIIEFHKDHPIIVK